MNLKKQGHEMFDKELRVRANWTKGGEWAPDVHTFLDRYADFILDEVEKGLPEEYPELGYKDRPFYGTGAARGHAMAHNAALAQVRQLLTEMRDTYQDKE